MIVDISAALKNKDRPVSFSAVANLDAQEIAEYRIIGDVTAEGTLLCYEERVDVSLSVTFTASTQCARCLEDVKISDTFETEAVLLKEYDGQQPDATVYLDPHRVDITPIVTGEISLNLPTRVYCREDCKGLCPVCGVNLNDGQCEHDKTIIEEYADIN